mgnify:CR=1 FL=1
MEVPESSDLDANFQEFALFPEAQRSVAVWLSESS